VQAAGTHDEEELDGDALTSVSGGKALTNREILRRLMLRLDPDFVYFTSKSYRKFIGENFIKVVWSDSAD